uniref:uncharacterized protein LOC120949074 n=1 Tax=Anopheles coluzzii TaxID=1518534 RepID=UPI0020FFE79E|nr:uncharacterized protein LOC120949074 [Anopheles coluzzii]
MSFWVTLVLAAIVSGRSVRAISYRKDTGFATDGKDQFVFREPGVTAVAREPSPVDHGQFTPMYTPHYSADSPVKRAGRIRFVDDSDASPFTTTVNGAVSGSNFFGKGSVADVSPAGSPFGQREGDQFYTVGASIQFAGGNAGGDTITPPPPPPAGSQQKPKRKKNKYKYVANDKIYNADGGFEQPGQYGAYSTYTGTPPQRFSAPLQGNYLTVNGARPQQQQGVQGQYDGSSMLNYPELQKQQYPFSIAPQSGAYNPYASYNPYQYPSESPYPYASESPYATNPYQQQPQGYYPPQQSLPTSSGLAQPPNAQSILGVLQSIFNFAPGTFGSFGAATTPQRPVGAFASPGAGFGAVGGGVGGQLRQALDNISENDELQCVPKLICMMSRSSTGQGFSSYVNRGLLSTILTAVPDSSPWLKFSRAALLGYGIGANSCDAYYPKCPKDEMQILYYLNNHRGGFFRFFSNGEQQQQQQQQQYQQQQYG